MRPKYRLLATAVLTIAAAGNAQAAKVTAVDIRGLGEVETLNVRGALSLVQAIGKDLSGRRLGYLVREADDETREALEPFGYYSPKIEVTREGSGDNTKVIVTVALEEPVRVRRADIAIIGEGSEDRYLKEDLAAFRPQTGDIFDHALYEASKTKITRRLAERGYFDADFTSRRVEVTRAQHAADIDLVWTSGGRYDMGPITFVQTPQTIIRNSLLDKLVYWEQGSYYHQGKLDRFRESLARLDYFSSIEIEPDPEKAVDNQVPVAVTLTPAKRTVYTAGVSYGTDSGAGVRLGMERRYVNDRGHKALGQIDWTETRKTATVQYRIPAFAWLDGWYTFSAQYYDEQSDYIDTRKVELVASRSGQISRRLNAIASIHALRERWAYVADDDGDVSTPVQYRNATFLYPSLRGDYIDADDRIFPRKAIGITLEVRGGLEGVGSDANFLQTWGVARWYHGMGANNRLIVRGEAGGTFTNALVDMPPSLRFFAGGDRSIRGYAYREVGPSTIGSDGKKYALGAKNVLTGSVEFEHYFNDTWGAAGFVDAGDAFDDTPDIHTGVGFGVRWKSPVGPVRFDIAHGLKDPDSQYEIYLNIGADW
ncbi:outer membrane protein assembly factor [Lysobacter arenosi]|uniref:Translocation and assembly module subunit TamA n=1 Tax=Lysobacter arenosi TaxID=2795387 RepID=A0ABX7R7U3_9GAMM|nr:autotransporter assembly complex family protein [Lysobacter arenosi]QSX74182.1 outer membrane protein assembly factor [Lysobacter arenosi]